MIAAFQAAETGPNDIRSDMYAFDRHLYRKFVMSAVADGVGSSHCGVADLEHEQVLVRTNALHSRKTFAPAKG